MDDEQFNANLETIVKQMQDGEIVPDKVEESPDKLLRVLAKHKREVSKTKEKSNEVKKNEKPKVLDPNTSPDRLSNHTPEKPRRKTTMTLEKFGRRSSDQMDKILTKKNDVNDRISITARETKQRTNKAQNIHLSTSMDNNRS